MTAGGAVGLAESLGELGGLFLGMLGGFFRRAPQAGQPRFRRLPLVVYRRENVREDVELIGPVALLGRPAVDHWVGKAADMPRGFPNSWVHDDRAVEPDHVVAHPDVVTPPGVFDVALELDAQRAVVPESVDSAVNFARGKDKPPALAQRDQLVHVVQHILTFPWGTTLAGPAPSFLGISGVIRPRFVNESCCSSATRLIPVEMRRPHRYRRNARSRAHSARHAPRSATSTKDAFPEIVRLRATESQP